MKAKRGLEGWMDGWMRFMKATLQVAAYSKGELSLCSLACPATLRYVVSLLLFPCN